ncbi:hypothetical protein EMPS_00419 [Entomortierella parvispora]|uniref:Major facilitator superfamily (MFS) profile domain-containing protein n=1 Tax=Entomortierella parvispora TaxID=205924 RepID=A0A9P3H0X8_9FUNG|nr:hypothetical protein EMPS_00419 [Entomortierella parvispora]
MADQHRPESEHSTINDTMVSINDLSDQKIVTDAVPAVANQGPQLPPDYVALEDRDPSTLTKFEKMCLKCQPLMLYVVSMAQFLDIVNGASMTVAMLPIARDLNFEVQQQQWLISSYALSFGGLLLIAGRMGDLFGHRRVFLSGLFWFGLWSMINGFSKSPVMLCISRALQGMGAAAQIPTALALIAIRYPVGKARTRALSVFGAIGAIGAVTGLLLSGALTSTIGWQWIFFLSAIMSCILFVIGFFAIPNTPGLHGVSPKVDIGGSFTATGGIVCVIYYISSGVETGWASVKTLPVLFVGLALLLAFFFLERRISYPIMPFHIWKHRAFAVSFALIFIMQACFQGFLYYSTLIFQEVLGYSIMRTALSYLVHGLTAIVFYSVLGKFLPRMPLKYCIALGFFLLSMSCLTFAFVTHQSTYWVLPFLALIMNVLGLGLVMLPAQITALRDAADDDQGVVGAIYNVGLQIGAPFGLAVLTVISGKINGDNPNLSGAEMMHGYKQALFGDMAFGLLGLVVTLLLLPHSKPMSAKTVSDKVEETAAMEENKQGEALAEATSELEGSKTELDQDFVGQQGLTAEENAVVAKVQFA